MRISSTRVVGSVIEVLNCSALFLWRRKKIGVEKKMRKLGQAYVQGRAIDEVFIRYKGRKM